MKFSLPEDNCLLQYYVVGFEQCNLFNAKSLVKETKEQSKGLSKACDLEIEQYMYEILCQCVGVGA